MSHLFNCVTRVVWLKTFQSKDTGELKQFRLLFLNRIEPGNLKMPYKTNYDLPSHIRSLLSEEAQYFYRVAFNSALQWYGEEEKAHRIAASAIKSQSASLYSAIE
jgi:cation transport regulator